MKIGVIKMTRVRLHTTISKETEEKIKKLENRFGTKSKIVETAISALEKAETVGSCDDCPLREDSSYRIILDLVSMREDMLDRLMNIILGETDFQVFFNDIRKRAKEEAFLFSQAISFKKRNDFQSMVNYLKMWERISNHITILQIFEHEHVILLRIRSFQKFPELVIEIIRGHLEGLDITFELDLGLDNLLKVKWISPELARISRVTRDMDQKLNAKYNELLKKVPTHPYKKNMIPISWELIDYLTERYQNEMIPIELVNSELNYIQNIKLEEYKDGNELDIIRKLLTHYEDNNYLTFFDISSENNKILISIKCRTEPILNLLIQIITIIISKIFIKLKEMDFKQNSVILTFEKVKKDDPKILDVLTKEYILSDLAFDLVPKIFTPKELLQKLNTELYKKNLNTYKKIYKLTGIEIANALMIYCKKRNLSIKDIAGKWIEQFLRSGEHKITIEDNVITIFYLTTDKTVMESHKNLIEGLFSKISKKVKIDLIENMLTVKT